MDKVSIAPTENVLSVFANQNLTWKIAISEEVDNARDANATNVKFIFDGRRALYISDDGLGCAPNKLTKMVQIGGHEKHKSGTTRLGRYGIGAKDAALWIGGDGSSISITSIHENKKSSLHVDWKQIREHGWDIDPPTVTDVEPTERGTEIIIKPITRTPPHGQQWKDLLEEIGYIYSPAIKREGFQITFQRSLNAQPEVVKRWEMPPLDDEKPMINREVFVGNQRVHVHCGIVKEGYDNPRRGLTYFHEFRVIVPHSSKGCGPYNISRVCGYVELDNSWPLTKNKDNIRNPEELYGAVEAACVPVLTAADELGEVLQSRAFEDAVSERVRFALSNNSQPGAKGKRRKGDTHLTVIPTGTGGKHKRADNTQPGARFPSSNSSNLQRVIFDHMGATAGVGRVDKPNIYLNLDVPYVQYIRNESNTDAATMLAVGLIAKHQEESTDSGQFWLKGVYRRGDFTSIVGAILSGMTVPEVKGIAAA